MTDPVIDQLSEGQRDCLRLVLAHHNSKEIARELGISPHTVDQRLRIAMRILAVPSRFEAARKFAAFDSANQYQSLIYQAPDVEQQAKKGKLEAPAGIRDGAGAEVVISGLDAQGNAAVVTREEPENLPRRFPFPRYRGDKNRFGSMERLGWVLAIAIGSALSFGGLIAGLESLSRLSR